MCYIYLRQLPQVLILELSVLGGLYSYRKCPISASVYSSLDLLFLCLTIFQCKVNFVQIPKISLMIRLCILSWLYRLSKITRRREAQTTKVVTGEKRV